MFYDILVFFYVFIFAAQDMGFSIENTYPKQLIFAKGSTYSLKSIYDIKIIHVSGVY